MKNVEFTKYTSNGNSFIILDEILDASLSEKEKAQFADMATDVCFGIGADNLLVVQSCTHDMLSTINHHHGYWEKLPDANEADYIFRMFEPDGTEALCCGNGLLSIASLLSHRHHVLAARIMTEIPFARPSVIRLGTNSANNLNWVNLGEPRQTPANLVERSLVKSVDGAIDVIEALKIRFRKHDLKPYTSKSELTISGYLVFTGEPHLVVLADSGLSIPDLGPMLFVEGIKMPAPNGQIEKRVGFGSWLINHIGLFVNKTYRDMFPAGISINFVRVDQDQHLAEYRCFERGIDKETLACGTGALAVSYVVHQLGLLKENPICLWPHRCRWHEAQAQIIVEHKDGWLLSGHPAYLYDGQFRYQSAQAFEVPNPKIACLESDPALQAQDTSALPSAAS